MTSPELPPQGRDSRDALVSLHSEIGKAVVGQEGALTGLIIALVADGHVLLEGVPGVAKTLLVRTLARCIDLTMTRVQFTPDLMPAGMGQRQERVRVPPRTDLHQSSSSRRN